MEESLRSFINISNERFALPCGVSSVEFKIKNNQEIKIKQINDVKVAKPHKPLPRTPNQRPPSTFGSIPLPLEASQVLPSVIRRKSSLKILDIINEPQYIVEPTGHPVVQEIEDVPIGQIEIEESPRRKLSVSIEDVLSEDSLSDSEDVGEIDISNIKQRKLFEPLNAVSPRNNINSPRNSTPSSVNPNLIVLAKGPSNEKIKKKNKFITATKKIPKFLLDKFKLPLHVIPAFRRGNAIIPVPQPVSPPPSPPSDITISAADIRKLNAASFHNLRKLNKGGPLPKIISVAITALDDKGRQVPLPKDIADKLPYAINSIMPHDVPFAVQSGGSGGIASEISVDLMNSEGKKEKMRIKQCSIM